MTRHYEILRVLPDHLVVARIHCHLPGSRWRRLRRWFFRLWR